MGHNQDGEDTGPRLQGAAGGRSVTTPFFNGLSPDRPGPTWTRTRAPLTSPCPPRPTVAFHPRGFLAAETFVCSSTPPPTPIPASLPFNLREYERVHYLQGEKQEWEGWHSTSAQCCARCCQSACTCCSGPSQSLSGTELWPAGRYIAGGWVQHDTWGTGHVCMCMCMRMCTCTCT